MCFFAVVSASWCLPASRDALHKLLDIHLDLRGAQLLRIRDGMADQDHALHVPRVDPQLAVQAHRDLKLDRLPQRLQHRRLGARQQSAAQRRGAGDKQAVRQLPEAGRAPGSVDAGEEGLGVAAGGEHARVDDVAGAEVGPVAPRRALEGKLGEEGQERAVDVDSEVLRGGGLQRVVGFRV